LFAGIAGCATTPAKPDAHPSGSLVFGIAAYAGSQPGEKDAAALEAALSHRLQSPWTVVVFGDESSLASALAEGSVDAAWMPPLSFVEARSRGAVLPVAKVTRGGFSHYRSAIFARADSGVSALSDLKGSTVAWVDHRSAAGYLFPLAMLQRAKLKPSELFSKEEFVGDHAAVCRAVLEGKAKAGATFVDDRPAGAPIRIDGCAQALGDEEAAKLSIISISKPIPNDVVAVRPGCSPEVATSLKDALVSLATDDAGRKILAAVFKADGFADASVEEFGLGSE
jgi:phosphonate transport system substrate-binding protein